jgi:20S proteasome subunit alpha 2
MLVVRALHSRPVAAKNGVVIATEKKMPSVLMDDASLEKISKITDNTGLVYSGIGPDSRVLVRKARKTAQEYARTYGETMPNSQLVREIATVMQEFTQSGCGDGIVAGSCRCSHVRGKKNSGVRPFGVSLLMAGWDKHTGGHLYQVCIVVSVDAQRSAHGRCEQIDPSGSYWMWKASAIGKNMNFAKTFLEKR